MKATKHPTITQVLEASALYFALVFGAVHTMLVGPRVGLAIGETEFVNGFTQRRSPVRDDGAGLVRFETTPEPQQGSVLRGSRNAKT